MAVEEEFQILDPRTLALAQRFEELRDAAPAELDIRGELLARRSRSPPRSAPTSPRPSQRLSARRRGLFALAREHGRCSGATATHPFSSWKDQHIIDTPHYRLVEDSLKYVAWRNNTWSVHVHVGVRGGDRAVAVSDAMRAYLPTLLALSAELSLHRGRVDPARLGARADLRAHVPALRRSPTSSATGRSTGASSPSC